MYTHVVLIKYVFVANSPSFLCGAEVLRWGSGSDLASLDLCSKFCGGLNIGLKELLFLMAENSINFAKERLKNCDLLPRIIHYSEEEVFILLTLYVKNYGKLKRNIIYYVSAKLSEYTWTNKLVKANGTLFFFMSSNSNIENYNVYICKIRGDNLVNVNNSQRENLLILEFCDKAIVDSTNDYLHGDSLIIEFQHVIKRSKHDDCSSNYRAFQTLKDHTPHYVDFKSLYFHYLRSNLKIVAGNMQWDCHIAVFEKHSKVLADFFQKHKLLSYKKYCIAINENPVFIQIVITYMYYGFFFPLDIENMKRLYQVAKKLQIDSLMKNCMEYLESNLSSSMK